MSNIVPLARTGRLPAHASATLVGIDDGGRALVRHAWHPEPVIARTSVALGRDPALAGCEVLIAFVDDDPSRPVVTGLLAERVDDPRFDRLRDVDAGDRLHANAIDFEAAERISIRCGESSILMDRLGKVVIRGRDILTRASSTNRIKGGSVGIN